VEEVYVVASERVGVMARSCAVSLGVLRRAAVIVRRRVVRASVWRLPGTTRVSEGGGAA